MKLDPAQAEEQKRLNAEAAKFEDDHENDNVDSHEEKPKRNRTASEVECLRACQNNPLLKGWGAN